MPTIATEYRQSDLITVLTAAEKRLIDGAGIPANACFIALSRPEHILTSGDENGTYVLLYPGDATYDQPMLDGGGRRQCNENTSLIAEIYNNAQLDQVGHDREWLINASRGIFVTVKKVLKAYTGQMLQGMVGETLAMLLRQPLLPQTRSRPQREDELAIGSIALTFECVFEWDLTPDQ